MQQLSLYLFYSFNRSFVYLDLPFQRRTSVEHSFPQGKFAKLCYAFKKEEMLQHQTDAHYCKYLWSHGITSGILL